MSESKSKHAANTLDDFDVALAEANAAVADDVDESRMNGGATTEQGKSHDQFASRSITTAAQLRAGPGRSELPDELQSANKDDTSCDVCGVSFLVYSEMKVGCQARTCSMLPRHQQQPVHRIWRQEWKPPKLKSEHGGQKLNKLAV
jgi:hypothetical protein